MRDGKVNGKCIIEGGLCVLAAALITELFPEQEYSYRELFCIDERLLFVFTRACVPSILGFVVPPPRGIGSSYESSYEPLEIKAARNSPGLLILNGPVQTSEFESEPVESDIEPVESDIEPAESSDNVAQAVDGEVWAAGGQARPDRNGAVGGAAGANGAGPAQGSGGQVRPDKAAGNPQQISSSHGAGRAVGLVFAVGAFLLVALAAGVAAYVIRRQRRTRNAPERLN
ncbi:hypothetical protein BSL78_21012 [Apostichopus japonicus]|uniref:Uncharacterized protein n=1 Tax=Stichopus japonicus TaxID=307972 RepID=A0A2G8K2A6_STIJA|nr:hypothetical protein BSL78_21012 [Apostichopus japonicus]